MALRAQVLRLAGYRNFRDASLELAPGTTVLVGGNAVGKTNLVEALQLLSAARSFRHPASAELIGPGATGASLDLSIVGDGRRVDMGLDVEPGRRSFRRNGKGCRAAAIRGVLPSVLFCPDDLGMVKGAARRRRSAIDEFGVQLSARYARLVAEAARILEQRNALLRDGGADELLAAWDQALTDTGSALLWYRLALLRRVRAAILAIHRELSGGERLGLAYRSSVCPQADLLAEVWPDEGRGIGRDELEGRYRTALAAARAEERRRGLTLIGAHRDEIVLTIDGRAARSLASQGQQRTLVLAWKIAEVAVARDVVGRAPLLLLDDVMSELDEPRREAVLGFIADEIQTVITTTNLGYFSAAMRRRARVVSVGHEGIDEG